MDNFVWQDILRIPISYLMKGAYFLTQNYTLALILFAIAIKLLLLPFSIKQQKNMIKQAKLRPKEQAIRDKYKGRNDTPTQQKMTQELQDMYQRENYNPMGGCLPTLLQFPILFALIQVIYDPLKYLCSFTGATIKNLSLTIAQLASKVGDLASLGLNDAVTKKVAQAVSYLNDGTLADAAGKATDYVYKSMTGLEKINAMRAIGLENFSAIEGFDASKLPNLHLFGMDLGASPDLKKVSILWLIPILTFVVYYLSMRLTRKMSYQPAQTADQANSMKMLDFTMPLLSVWISFIYPAAVGIYWIFQSILGTLQQFLLYKFMPYPKYTDEELKAAIKEYNGKTKKNNKNKAESSDTAAPAGEKKKVRSLHHIDDDDYDEKGNLKPESERTDTEHTKYAEDKKPSVMSSMLSEGKLKEDPEHPEE